MPSSTSDLFSAALEAFQQGRLAQAEARLRELLAQDPEQAVALNLLGVVLHGLGRSADAIAALRGAAAAPGATAEHHQNLGILLLEAGHCGEAVLAGQRAITLQPRFPEGFYNLGNALLAAHRVEEAIAAFRQAIGLRPDYLAAHTNLAAALREQGRLTEAVGCCRTVLQLTPKDPVAHLNLGSLLRDLGQSDPAIAAYRQALTLQPNFPDAHHNLGALLFAQGRHAEAAGCFQATLRLVPNHPTAALDLGAVFQAQERFQEAGHLYQQALSAQPGNAAAWSALGTTFQAQDRLEEAIECYRKALTLDPHFPAAHNNLGLALAAQYRLAEAVVAYRAALAVQPDYHEAWNNLGNAYGDLGQPDPALAAYQQALLIRPDHTGAHWNKSLLLLLAGQLPEGFTEYEWRWLRFPELRRPFRQPRWDGSELGGRTLLIHAEQGFGDSIQFARYLPLVARKNGAVLVVCPAELKALLQSVPGPQRVFAPTDPLPDFDLQLPMMSLAAVLGTTLETIPNAVPYLYADPARAAVWRERLAGDGPGLRVGLSWAGRATHHKDRYRSCTLEHLASLACIPNVRFYSLQKWQPARSEPAAPFPLIDYTAELHDFADTAALLANLDLIIGVDTAIVHVAGGLGRPVWTLLAYNNDWRWLRQRSDSPWYPSMRLFRQSRLGDWSSVLPALQAQLVEAAASQGAPNTLRSVKE